MKPDAYSTHLQTIDNMATRYSTLNRNVVFVGCGGVASWLLPVLLKFLEIADPKPKIFLMDGDLLEAKNLDRQLFSADDIGKNKASALAERYASEYKAIVAVPQFLGESWDAPKHALYFGCADNHPARRKVLQLVDDHGGRAIIGGNEYTDSEAYYYEREFSGTDLDPRKYYPELMTVTTGDPTQPQSCQGEAAIEHPQLVLANFSAANHMMHLLLYHCIERPKMSPEDLAATRDYWPVRHHNSFCRFGTELVHHKQKIKEIK